MFGVEFKRNSPPHTHCKQLFQPDSSFVLAKYTFFVDQHYRTIDLILLPNGATCKSTRLWYNFTPYETLKCQYTVGKGIVNMITIIIRFAVSLLSLLCPTTLYAYRFTLGRMYEVYILFCA